MKYNLINKSIEKLPSTIMILIIFYILLEKSEYAHRFSHTIIASIVLLFLILWISMICHLLLNFKKIKFSKSWLTVMIIFNWIAGFIYFFAIYKKEVEKGSGLNS